MLLNVKAHPSDSIARGGEWYGYIFENNKIGKKSCHISDICTYIICICIYIGIFWLRRCSKNSSSFNEIN